MKIQQLFLKPVERPIDGVIKADDQRNLLTELEEYVVTKDVMRGLSQFTERYLNERHLNGAWISGFFGSGKSHLLKMLSYLLDERQLPDGRRPADVLLPKVDDAIVRADLAKVARIPSRSILFNVDQKYDGIGGNPQAAILEVFVKVLNELQGYYSKQGYLGHFERQLDERGELERFRETYRRVNGTAWEDDREAVLTVCREEFGRAYAEHFGGSAGSGEQAIQQVREDYRVSVESFAHMVKRYLDRQPRGFRVNFFADEIGQFVGRDSQRMLNLQTIAETLATVCDGHAWVFVTSQADLEGVIGQLSDLRADDISKIQGRFVTRVTLASADVREVIQKRLLAKHEAEPEALTAIWDREKDNLQTLYRFDEGTRRYATWRGSDEFCALYPFVPYQFELFQTAITELSKHGAFTGRYVAVGERSMLAVFQEVAKAVRHDAVGRLAPFDRMYDGIAASLRGDMQTQIRVAEGKFGADALDVRVLKALFLLKWVREFKATPRNVAILLIERPDVDVRAHEAAVKQALARLEADSYLQRHGDAYEFLTDAEKDIEVEIKNTPVDDAAVAAELEKTLFGDVLRDPKIRYEANGKDYPYARKLDDAVMGRDQELAIHVVTPEHPNHAEPMVLAAQNMGRPELLAILPADGRLNDLARLWLRTDKYVRQNGGTADETRRSIVEQRGRQNGERRQQMMQVAADLLGRAPLYLNGSRLESVGQGDARNRFARAAQELVAFAYPSLKMLKGAYDEASLAKTLTERDDLFAGGDVPLSEAEQELLLYVRKNKDDGQRTSVEEMVRQFARRPHGWYPMAVLTLLARLFRAGKVELRAGSELLDAAGALERLRNARHHGAVRVRPQEEFPPQAVSALKAFHHDFFDTANPGTDARSVATATAQAFADRARELKALAADAARYPFLAPLGAAADRLAALAGRDHAGLLNGLDTFRDELLDLKEDVLGPAVQFMRGPQRAAYDEAIAFLREEAANLAELPEAELQPLRVLERAEHPYRGPVVRDAKAATERLRAQVAGRLAAERTAAEAAIATREGTLRALDEFQALDAAAQAQVLAASAAARVAVAEARFVAALRDRVRRYVSDEYPAQLTLAAGLAAAAEAARRAAAAPTPEPTGTTGGVTSPEGRDATLDGGVVTIAGSATASVGATETLAPPAPAPVRFVQAARLSADCGIPILASEADVERWLDALRTAARAELAQGHRIIVG